MLKKIALVLGISVTMQGLCSEVGNSLFEEASKEGMNTLSIAYDTLISDKSSYHHKSGSIDFHYLVWLVNEYDPSIPDSEQDITHFTDSVMPYETAEQATHYFQDKFNGELKNKIDRHNLLKAYRLVNMDYVKRKHDYEVIFTLTGDQQANESKLIKPESRTKNPNVGLSLFLLDVLLAMSMEDNGLSYESLKLIIERSDVQKISTISAIIYCEGKTLRNSVTYHIVDGDELPTTSTLFCDPHDMKVIPSVEIKADAVFEHTPTGLTLEESLYDSGLNRAISNEYLSFLYDSYAKRDISGYIYATDEDVRSLSRQALSDYLPSNEPLLRTSLAISMMDKGRITNTERENAPTYLGALGRKSSVVQAISSLIVSNDNIVSHSPSWKTCTNNSLPRGFAMCANITRTFFVGAVPSALDIVFEDPNARHAYYLLDHLRHQRITEHEAKVFINKYQQYLNR